tara:strand:+ start:501 stop:1001 length:501 start_codon:yes stop_codon:yes gene_type:complete
MANQLRIHTSCEVVNDNSVANEGTSAGDYTNLNLDVHSESRSWGGNYNISQEYNVSDVCYWKGVVPSSATVDYLDNSGWTEASDITAGNIPATAHLVAVEYVRQSLGADSVVNVTVSGEIFAALTPGESVVIPMHMGEVVGSIGIHDANYSNGSREAIVNVMIAGV